MDCSMLPAAYFVRPCLNWIIIGPRKRNTVWAAIAIDAHALTCLRSFIRLTSNFTNQDSFAELVDLSFGGNLVVQDITAEAKDDESDGTDAPPQAKLD